MDRRYFQIIGKAAEIVTLVNAIARNANYSNDARQVSDENLKAIDDDLESVKRCLQYIVDMQQRAALSTNKNEIYDHH